MRTVSCHCYGPTFPWQNKLYVIAIYVSIYSSYLITLFIRARKFQIYGLIGLNRNLDATAKVRVFMHKIPPHIIALRYVWITIGVTVATRSTMSNLICYLIGLLG
jgi:NAD/NADP transhydrogenase beta subunit